MDFKRFRDALAHLELCGCSPIPKGRLEKADWTDTKNLMLEFYGAEAALDVAITVLEHIQLRNDAALLRESRERDHRSGYKKAVRQTYGRMKDMNARVGDSVSLSARYARLVMVTEHRDEQQREREVTAVGRGHADLMKERASSSIAVNDLFKPDDEGWSPKEVVLLGAAGMGKTMTARKIMLDWACDRMFEEFDFVFYIHCREGNLLAGEASMADLLARCCPGSALPLDAVLQQPEKLLFIIDGFDELRFSVEQPWWELCEEPGERRPVDVVLASLLRRRLLCHSSLLITTRPAALQSLRRLLEHERCAEILGFSEGDRRDYFHRFFGSAEQAAAAFRFVRGHELLFTMCLVPIVCWIVCTVLRQQLGRAGGLAHGPRTTTGIYVLYLSALLCSLRGRQRQEVPAVLRRLCCLAAGGIRGHRVLFEEKEVQGLALGRQETLPLLLNEHLFQKDISCVSSYSFIHLSFQEFFAALFYLLEDEGEAQEPPVGPSRDVKELLQSYSSSRNYFILTVRFLFGLLNEDRRRELEQETGCKISARITEDLLEWLQDSQKTALALLLEETGLVRDLELCHCLYELQDERLVVTALCPFTGLRLHGLNLNRFDQVVLAFSLRRFPGLQVLELGHCCFLWDEPEDNAAPQPCKKPHREAQEEGMQSPIHLLCQALEASGCKLKTLRLDRCELSSACGAALGSVLGTSPALTELSLAGNKDLGDEGVRLLCEGLRSGAGSLRELRLGGCSLTAAGCRALASVLAAAAGLELLDLSDNAVGDGGVRELCAALGGPGRGLQKLELWQCGLTELGCESLAAVLPDTPSLAELHLGGNAVGDGGVRRLSRGLRDPRCRLRTLRLWQCGLTELGCETLAAVLPDSPSLAELHLGGNAVGDGGVRRLSRGLRDPRCRLRTLSLRYSRLTSACCQDLAAVLSTSPSLEELDLSFSDGLRDAGVELLCQGLQPRSCRLRTLRLGSCRLTGACRRALAMGTPPLTCLDLSDNELGADGVLELCRWLRSPSCPLRTLGLSTAGLPQDVLQDLTALQQLKPSLRVGYLLEQEAPQAGAMTRLPFHRGALPGRRVPPMLRRGAPL
ncbi:NACHT, LRR and PYD domains-containing protein 6 [Melopsittacus undulatus]|uniref:NACHT, LRR and PYD domains-containing protein 6 n=1 Tax=Melopsittacus undulatus TaxID=13146 RepID=UPI00146C8602|nr:NACHT, LRR and PYD domains-containing protein 6 [Melopsittacus undulatus]